MLTATLALSTAVAGADGLQPLHLAEAVKLSATAIPVSVARLDSAIAQAGLGAQRATLLPQLSFTANAARQNEYFPQSNGYPSALGPFNELDARIRVGQALIDVNAYNLACAAERRMAVADAAAALALEDAASRAGEAYLQLAQAQALIEVRTLDLQLALDLLALAKAQVDAGTAEAITQTRAESRVADERAALTAANGAVLVDAITLARALNLDPATALVAADALSEELGAGNVPADIAGATAAAHRTRPELKVSIETLAAIEADRRAATGARLPRLSAYADGGRTGPSPGNTINTWEFGLSLTVPLLDRSRDDEQAARVRVEQQALLLKDLGNQIDAEVRQAAVALQNSKALFTATLESRRLAELEVSQARARFASGVAGNLELVDAQTTLTNAREQVLAAQQAAALAQVRLARAVGVTTTIK
jgi:cobalt-zinc-cadmium efflux system outer membrane protein